MRRGQCCILAMSNSFSWIYWWNEICLNQNISIVVEYTIQFVPVDRQISIIIYYTEQYTCSYYETHVAGKRYKTKTIKYCTFAEIVELWNHVFFCCQCTISTITNMSKLVWEKLHLHCQMKDTTLIWDIKKDHQVTKLFQLYYVNNVKSLRLHWNICSQ